MNPSTEDILKAIDAVNAKNVIILPNNKNIFMAAQVWQQQKYFCPNEVPAILKA